MRPATKVLVALLLVVTPAVLTEGGPSGPGSAAGANPVDDAEGRFLTTRPPVGPTFVVHVGGEPTGRVLTARTLQGIVNRTAARLYVIDGGDTGAQRLLDRYVARGLVTVTGTGSLDDALAQFAGEVTGYVLADPAEPWSVHGASVIAGLAGGVVATADQVPVLQGHGLVELDDTRGRWPDASTAYLDLAATYRPQLASDTVAIVRPTDTLWDFVAQQGLLPVFARPSDGDWATVTGLLHQVPDGSPVYGYVSDTGEEEAVALAALASTDLVLVPTDTTRNLSFHVAVGADLPRRRIPAPDLTDVEPCLPETLNVVVGVTDGDNLNVPLNHFLRDANWDHPRRGELPIGWSMAPGLAVLAPAAWDLYVDEATPNDELVAMIGWAYGAPALLTDPGAFYEHSFALMDELGLTTFWSLGGGLETPGASYWDAFDTAAGDGVPHSVLVGYGNGTGAAFHSPAGRPAFTSRAVYSETPAQIAGHVQGLLATDPADRPLVNFLSATNWSNPVGSLIEVLAPFEDQGVRFLTPAQAAACMPEPPEPPPPAERGPGSCLPDGPVTQHGLPLISDPVAAEIGREPLTVAPGIAVTASPDGPVAPGDTIDYRAELTLSFDDLAHRMLDERVRPVIEAGYGPELAATGWMAFTFAPLHLPFPLPAGARPSGDPTVDAPDGGVAAAWSGEELVVTVDQVGADTRSATAPVVATVSWSVTVTEDAPPGGQITLHPGALAFDLLLDVGVVLGDFPLSGGATAGWSCLAADATLAATAVAGSPGPPVRPGGPMPGPTSTTTTTAPPAPPTTDPPGPTPPATVAPPPPAAPTTTSPGGEPAPSPAPPTEPRPPAPIPRPAPPGAPPATPRPGPPTYTG
jgi:hypothetical protein